MVNIPLLKSKLIPPLVQDNYLDRPYLLKLLENGLEQGKKVALLSAPAGYGKTTLISSWLKAKNHSFAWYSIDCKDNQLPRFFQYIASSLGSAIRNMTVW